ncbi:MAG TPA: hypothetical protein VGH06_03315 [Candidatus Udaeobacter sp.]|jgi:hypothetical protein
MSTNIAELEWARIRDAQRAYPASRSQYYNWIEARMIRSRRIGGARFIEMQSLRELFDKASSKPPKKISRMMSERAYASADKRREVRELGGSGGRLNQ